MVFSLHVCKRTVCVPIAGVDKGPSDTLGLELQTGGRPHVGMLVTEPSKSTECLVPKPTLQPHTFDSLNCRSYYYLYFSDEETSSETVNSTAGKEAVSTVFVCFLVYLLYVNIVVVF